MIRDNLGINNLFGDYGMKMKRMLPMVIVLAVFLVAPFQAWAISLDIDTVLYEGEGVSEPSLLDGTAVLTVSG